MDGSSRFAEFRARMLEAVDSHLTARARIKQIRTEVQAKIQADRQAHPHVVGGVETPLELDVRSALKNHLWFDQAKDDREAFRREVTMWGLAALVEAFAALDAGPPT